MNTKSRAGSAFVIAAIVLLLGFTGVVVYRNLRPSADYSAAGGVAAKTVAPAVQRYPDGTVVPYPAAPAGAIPGVPQSVARNARVCSCCGQPIPDGTAAAAASGITR